MNTLRHRFPLLVAVLLAVALPLFAVAPAEASAWSSSAHTWWVAVGAQTKDGTISGMVYGPPKITIDNGDTVDFYANSLEIHTVTFTSGNKTPPYPFNPADINMLTAGNSATYTTALYNGTQKKDISSELLSTFNFGPAVIYGFTVQTSYKVKFDLTNLKLPVTIPYFCLVHPGMMGWITVQPKGWHYPHTQAYYNNEARVQAARVFTEGYHAWAYEALHFATNHRVSVGVTRDSADVMRFINGTQFIDEGQSITFKNNSMGPHTVTFGTEPTTGCTPDLGPQCDVGTTATATHATYKGGYFNAWLNPGQSITITFDLNDGSYQYYCALHDYQGMVATIVVY